MNCMLLRMGGETWACLLSKKVNLWQKLEKKDSFWFVRASLWDCFQLHLNPRPKTLKSVSKRESKKGSPKNRKASIAFVEAGDCPYLFSSLIKSNQKAILTFHLFSWAAPCYTTFDNKTKDKTIGDQIQLIDLFLRSRWLQIGIDQSFLVFLNLFLEESYWPVLRQFARRL